ncbi:unnamed protein product [Protopolystoma xenopodis]|uniref:Uncharacterized protein n=1 Tax=Protopolystoma xenopodis TaxID=117903 RepID=A0A3S5C152_9PLAT|nr:unnamed protein product [Protopolystoma xenopodis]
MTEIIEPTSSGLSGESGQIRPPSTSPTHHPDLKSLAHTFIDGSQSRSGTPYCQNEKVSADLRLSASEFAESIPEEIEEDDEVEEITGESRKCYKTDDWEVDRSTEIDAMGGDGGMLEEGEELYREKESLEEDCLKSELRPVLERRRREVMVARQQGVLLDRGHEIVRAFSMVGNDIELKELHRFPSNALSNSGKRPAHFSCRKQVSAFVIYEIIIFYILYKILLDFLLTLL